MFSSFRSEKQTWNANKMLEDNIYLNADIFLTPPKWCNGDIDGEETVSANHLFGPQFSAQA